MLELNKLYNLDCMEGMAQFPDKYFDLAIVDPPYGIGRDGTQGFATRKTKGFTFNRKEYISGNWDSGLPSKEYYIELFRTSKDQIIWGANYMTQLLPVLNNFIYWHKKGQSKDDKFNEGELAYTSTGRTKMVDIWWNGFGTINSGENRFHPTQKPVQLYKWILHNYAKPEYKIIDTHAGSCSSVIAFLDYGCDWIAFEIDKDYYEAASKRIEIHKQQLKLF